MVDGDSTVHSRLGNMSRCSLRVSSATSTLGFVSSLYVLRISLVVGFSPYIQEASRPFHLAKQKCGKGSKPSIFDPGVGRLNQD